MNTCRGCKIDFLPTRKGQKYHDRDCYRKSTTILRTCPECGLQFKRKFTQQVCCSPECGFAIRAKKNSKGEWLTCSFDGKTVYKMQSRIRQQNFCDVICKIAWLRSNKNHYKKRKHTVEEIEKIRKAGEERDYSKLSEKTRQKFRVNAANTILRPDVKKKTSQINKERLTGKKLAEETRLKIKKSSPKEENNHAWKGVDASYQAKHERIKLRIEYSTDCKDFDPKQPWLCSKRMENSNNDHIYSMNLNDWKRRCTNHNRMHDWQYGLFNPKGKAKRFVAKYGNLHKRSITIDAIVIDPIEMVEDVNRTIM